MSTNQEELLSRYLDGELNDSERDQVEITLQQDPEMRSLLEDMRAVETFTHDTLEGLADEPVPDQILAMLKSESVTDNVAANDPWWQPSWRGAVAASVLMLLGFFGGTSLNSIDRSTAPVEFSNILENQSSGSAAGLASTSQESVVPVMSFRSRDGDWCREYLRADGHGFWRGVACRRNDRWTIDLQVAIESPTPSDQYRAASGASTEMFTELVEQRLGGTPAGREEEDEAIASGWR